MSEDLQEQACWLLLTFESGLSTRIINEVIIAWCYQGNRSLQEFFAASQQEWSDSCHLGAESIKKLEQAKEKLVGQAFLVEQLSHDHIHQLTVLDDNYPRLLKSSLKPEQTPPVLFYAGDLRILERQTIAIIGSRKAGEESLAFTRAVSSYLAEQGANVISGNARGVDRTAYEGATSTQGYTTVVLPHGVRKLSGVQWRAILEKIETGKVLLLSQFHPDAQWVVSRAMERNKVVTGLAQIVIVAESDVQGGTWAGATGALRQNRPLYVRDTATSSTLPGNKALIELGGHPLPWPTEQLADVLSPLIQKSAALRQIKNDEPSRPDQLSLFVASGE
jgi:DNA processing protein